MIEPHQDSFDALGLSFPLFKAPHDQCEAFVGESTCSVLRETDEFCFRVDTILAACSRCGHASMLDCGAPENTDCGRCGSHLAIPRDEFGDFLASYRAIASGRAYFQHDTEYGSINLPTVQATEIARRVTSPSDKAREDNDEAGGKVIPGPGFVMTGSDLEEDARISTISEADILQLLSTPPYSAPQFPLWLIHCDRPMVFQGGAMLESVWDLPEDLKDRVVEDIRSSAVGDGSFPEGSEIFYFTCQACEALRTHIDY